MVDGKAQQLLATDSKNPLLRAAARHLSAQFSNLSEIKASQPLTFTINGQRQFVQVTPWQDKFGLDWLIVVTVPESDFMARINANTCTTSYSAWELWERLLYWEFSLLAGLRNRFCD